MTLTVYLLRHAKSSWDDPALDDIDRPLAPRGERAARAMARHLALAGVAPSLVLCSPTRRTRQTLDLVRSGLPAATEVRIEDALHRAGPAEVVRMLRRLPDDAATVMVVGHNPGMQKVALTLGGGGAARPRVAARYPTGALCELVFPVETWSAVAAGGAEITAFVTPKDL